MPKLPVSELELKRRIVRSCILRGKAAEGVTDEVLAKRTSVTQKTVGNREKRPEEHRLSELWEISKICALTDSEIIAIVRCIKVEDIESHLRKKYGSVDIMDAVG